MMAKLYRQIFAFHKLAMNVYKGDTVNPCLTFSGADMPYSCRNTTCLDTQIAPFRIVERGDSVIRWQPICWQSGGGLSAFLYYRCIFLLLMPVAGLSLHSLLHPLQALPAHVPLAVLWEAGVARLMAAVPAGAHHCHGREQ